MSTAASRSALITLLSLLPLVPAGAQTTTPAELYDLGQELFETHAPAELQAELRYPSRAEWDAFAARLQTALATGSLADLAAFLPEARAALAAIEQFPELATYGEWLRDRIDYVAAAATITQAPPPLVAPPPEEVPHLDLWLGRMATRREPAAARRYVSDLAEVFTQNQLPAALVWIAEVESSFNPTARSPVGALGLFQLMPATAEELGLRLRPFDERANPRRNTRAAATYLEQLHARFGSWPLALAAYNAGPGRVSRTLRAQDASTYAAIAESLPAETRMYVPKVLATLAHRAGARLPDLISQ